MSEHDRIRKLLPLAGAGDISPEEMRLVQAHLADCPECLKEQEDFAFLGGALRGLPTPQPGAEVLERVRAGAAFLLTERPSDRREAAMLAPLVVAGWIVTVATWHWVGAAGRWVLGLHLPEGSYTTAFAVYSAIGLVMACAAAIAVGRRSGAIGRMK